MYGSIFCRATRKPRASSSAPSEAAASPLPSEETTPPVTKMNFGPKSSLPFLVVMEPALNVVDFALPIPDFAVETRVAQRAENSCHVGSARDAERDDRVAAELGTALAGRRQPPLEPGAGGRASLEVQPGQRGGTASAREPRGLARARRCVQARGQLARAGDRP